MSCLWPKWFCPSRMNSLVISNSLRLAEVTSCIFRLVNWLTSSDKWWTHLARVYSIVYYYRNTSEMPGELSCQKNMISPHMKITCYLHMRKDLCCYGYIINHAFIWGVSKKIIYEKISKWKGLDYFIGVFIIRVLKNISLLCWAHSWNIFRHWKRNFVSLHGYVISSMLEVIDISIYSPLKFSLVLR